MREGRYEFRDAIYEAEGSLIVQTQSANTKTLKGYGIELSCSILKHATAKEVHKPRDERSIKVLARKNNILGGLSVLDSGCSVSRKLLSLCHEA